MGPVLVSLQCFVEFHGSFAFALSPFFLFLLLYYLSLALMTMPARREREKKGARGRHAAVPVFSENGSARVGFSSTAIRFLRSVSFSLLVESGALRPV